MTKAGLDLVEIAKNVGVIEFDIVDDDQLGQVMDELERLSKKAVSYSSPSMMKNFDSVNCAPWPRLRGMPPIM